MWPLEVVQSMPYNSILSRKSPFWVCHAHESIEIVLNVGVRVCKSTIGLGFGVTATMQSDGTKINK